MNDQLFSELIRSLIKDNPDISWELRRELCYALDPNSRAVRWCVEDFEQKASEVEEVEGFVIYDRSKFSEALDCMIENHDCNWGISWETLEHYLDDYCLLEGRSCRSAI